MYITQKEFRAEFPKISHFITTNAKYPNTAGNNNDFNLGEWNGQDIAQTKDNKIALCKDLGITINDLFVPKEIHHNNNCIIDEEFLSKTKQEQIQILNISDALITNQKSIAIAVSTADCVPILVYCPKKNVIAAIHAGWRGIVNNIINKTIINIIQKYAVCWNDLYFCLGPSIGGLHYEVDIDVWNYFCLNFNSKELSSILLKKDNNKYYPDIHMAVIKQIIRNVPFNHIFTDNIDNYSDCRFYSVRRNGYQTGRFLTGIMING